MGDKARKAVADKYNVLEEPQDAENIHDKNEPSLAPKERSYRLCYVLLITVAMASGSFIFGYTMSVVSGVTLYIDSDQDPNFRGTTNQQKEIIVSFALAGATLGSIFLGPLNDWVGRKPTIMLADSLFIIGAILMYFSPSIPWLVLGRFIVGLATGCASMSIPIYLSEMSPTGIRGAVVTTNILFATFGQLMSVAVCYPMRPNWRLMLGFNGLPSILHFLIMIILPESGRFLLKKGKKEEAILVFEKIYDLSKSSGKIEMEKELKLMDDSLQAEAADRDKKESTFLRFKELFIVYRRNVCIGTD